MFYFHSIDYFKNFNILNYIAYTEKHTRYLLPFSKILLGRLVFMKALSACWSASRASFSEALYTLITVTCAPLSAPQNLTLLIHLCLSLI